MSEAIANQSALDKFRNLVRDFNARYAVLSSTSYGARIARTGDNALMQEYGNTLARMTTVKNAIDRILTSYQGMRNYVGLGAIPLIPLAVIGGVSITVAAALKTIDSFMLRAGVAEIRQDDPSLTYEQAAARYNQANQSVFGKALDTAQMAMILGAAVLAYLFFKR